MTANVQSSEQFLKAVFLVYVVVVLEHGEGEALAEAARAIEEEKHIGSLHIFYKRCLVYIVAVIFPYVLEIHHSVRYALAIRLVLTCKHICLCIFECNGKVTTFYF